VYSPPRLVNRTMLFSNDSEFASAFKKGVFAVETVYVHAQGWRVCVRQGRVFVIKTMFILLWGGGGGGRVRLKVLCSY